MDFGQSLDDADTANLDLLSLNDQLMEDQDIDICDRCSVVCRKPEAWSARWKFLFRIETARTILLLFDTKYAASLTK